MIESSFEFGFEFADIFDLLRLFCAMGYCGGLGHGVWAAAANLVTQNVLLRGILLCKNLNFRGTGLRGELGTVPLLPGHEVVQ